MASLKFAADRLFTGDTWHGNDHAVIMDPTGMVEAILPLSEAGPDVQRMEGILSPGFVNCHMHLELSHMRGQIKQGQGMTGFLLSVIHGRKEEPEIISQAIILALAEMQANGIVAAGDICNTSDTLRLKMNSSIHFHHFIEAIGIEPALASQRYAQALQLYGQFVAAFPGRCSIVPHTPYTVSPELMRMVAETETNQLISLHSQESMDEEEFLMHGSGPLLSLFDQLKLDPSHIIPTGSRPLAKTLSRFMKKQSLLLVHNVTTTAEDIEYLKTNREHLPALAFCLCPRANLYIGNGLPDIPLLRDSGFPIVLGTDSLASNTSLSILDEIKTIHAHFPSLPPEEIWSWATLEGARVLQMQDSLGSLAPGKRPGLICCTQDLTQVRRLI
jgi:cytosine/adenosine deaminase-related metal-dependent hydrolase